MKRIPWAQFVLGLDRLMLGGQIATQAEAEERYDTIEAYLEACGWTWDLIIEEMCREQAPDIQTVPNN